MAIFFIMYCDGLHKLLFVITHPAKVNLITLG